MLYKKIDIQKNMPTDINTNVIFKSKLFFLFNFSTHKKDNPFGLSFVLSAILQH